MKRKMLMFLAKGGGKPVKIGIRHYLVTGKTIEFLNSWLQFLPVEKFQGVTQLHKLSKRLGRPISIYSWFRDEYGSSDGAGWGSVEITINPQATQKELLEITKEMQKKISSFVAIKMDDTAAEIKDIDPIKL